MKDLSIIELYKIKKRLINEDMADDDLMKKVIEAIDYKEKIIEDTSATGSPAGSGSVVSAQPSGLAGSTIGLNWSSNGGTTGSGDVSVPYNPSGSNRTFQKVPIGKNHGPRTGKKNREKKLDIKSLKKIFNKTEKSKGDKKVMNFDDFTKNDINTIKK